jgi:DNA repair protein RadA/Sms
VEVANSKAAKGKSTKHIVHAGSVLDKNAASVKSHFRKLSNTELQRVLQQGVKQGGIYLLWWEPGIGKSTIILQILQDLLSHNDMQIQYFTGEEQPNQIMSRWERLFSSARHPDPVILSETKDLSNSKDSSAEPQNGWAQDSSVDSLSQNDKNPEDSLTIYHSTHIEDILTTAESTQPDLMIIDSIQTIYSEHTDSSAWSPNQVKYCSEKLSEYGKQNNCTVIIIGHVTKGGEIAGPKYLEHIVDVVLYLEWDRFGQLRFLRSQKNRFGHTDDSGIFEMTLFGLQPVYDIKDRILQAASSMPWSVLSIGLDNGRPVITNVEVLLNRTQFKFPQRNCIGVDHKRVDLVIAILERYLKINLGLFDIFVNVPGEFDFRDSGLDLAIAAGIYSQYTNAQAPKDTIFLGELALSGKVVKSRLHDKRAKEVPDWFILQDPANTPYILTLKSLF